MRPPTISVNLSASDDWLELSDNFISNEIVKTAKEVVSGEDGRCLPYLQSYMNGDFGILVWFWAIIRDSPPREYRAIFYSYAWASTDRSWDAKTSVNVHGTDDSQHQSGSSMLVGVPYTVQDTEKMLLGSCGIPSVVRLQVLNQSLSGRREILDAFKLGILKHGLVLTRGVGERKGNFIVDRGINLPEPPNNIIQDSPQIVDTFARNDAEALRNVLGNPEMIRNTISFSIRVELGFYSKRCTFKECLGFDSELIDVYHCPVKPESGDFYTVHCDTALTLVQCLGFFAITIWPQSRNHAGGIASSKAIGRNFASYHAPGANN